MRKITFIAIALLFSAITFAQINVDLANATEITAFPFTDAGVDPTNGTQEENQVGCNFNVPSLDYKFEVIVGGTFTVTLSSVDGTSDPVFYRGTTLNETDPTLITVYDNVGADGAGCFDNDGGLDGTRTATVSAGDFIYILVANEGPTDIMFTGDDLFGGGGGGLPTDDCGAYSNSPALDTVDNDAVTDVMTITDTGTIADLDVAMDIEHTWIGDLTITLTSPAGTSAILFTPDCGNNDNLNVMFDDAGAVLVCDEPTQGIYAPSEALAVFNGEEFAGDWILSVADGAGGDGGTLHLWCLNPTFALPPVPTDGCGAFSNSPALDTVDNDAVTDVMTITEPGNIADLNVAMDITHTWTGDLTITLTSPAGTSAVLFTPDCGNNDNLNVMFDDEGADGVLVCAEPTQGVYFPSEALSIFDGEAFAGDWTLTVADGAGGDGGTLHLWCLVPDLVLSTADNVIDGFEFYPNPAKNTINLTALNTINNVEVFNMVGQKVISQNLNTTSGQLDISKLNAGMYVMKVTSNDQVGSYQIVKK